MTRQGKDVTFEVMRVRSALPLVSMLSLYCLLGIQVQAGILISRAIVDGRETVLNASAENRTNALTPLQLHSSSKSVAFEVQGNASAGNPVRLRYRMEGFDSSWRDLPSEMCVLVRLGSTTNEHVIAGTSETIRGETQGWTGRPDDSPLVKHMTSMTVPASAGRIRLFFISNGGPASLGMMVVDSIRVTVESPGSSTNMAFTVDHSTGRELDKTTGIPGGWAREGDKPDIAEIRWRSTPSPHPVIVLNDSDPDRFGVWKTPGIDLPLKQGDRIAVEWETAFSIGRGGKGAATYSGLKPGSYLFRVIAVHPDGTPTGAEISLPVIVNPPLSENIIFRIGIIIAICGLVALATRLVIQRRMQQQLEQSERQRMLEAERARIARDIHDDLGATLAQIAMLSEVAQADESENKPVGQLLTDIFNRAAAATRALDEIVWALKPANDTVEHLIGYLCQFAEDYLNLAGLRFRLDAPSTLPRYALTSIERHNIFLAAREAIHNAVKHAGASEVWIRVSVNNETLSLRIEDNGKGLPQATALEHNRGSANMKLRMEQIGGRYERTGAAGKGTTVELTFQLKDKLP